MYFPKPGERNKKIWRTGLRQIWIWLVLGATIILCLSVLPRFHPCRLDRGPSHAGLLTGLRSSRDSGLFPLQRPCGDALFLHHYYSPGRQNEHRRLKSSSPEATWEGGRESLGCLAEGGRLGEGERVQALGEGKLRGQAGRGIGKIWKQEKRQTKKLSIKLKILTGRPMVLLWCDMKGSGGFGKGPLGRAWLALSNEPGPSALCLPWQASMSWAAGTIPWLSLWSMTSASPSTTAKQYVWASHHPWSPSRGWPSAPSTTLTPSPWAAAREERPTALLSRGKPTRASPLWITCSSRESLKSHCCCCYDLCASQHPPFSVLGPTWSSRLRSPQSPEL